MRGYIAHDAREIIFGIPAHMTSAASITSPEISMRGLSPRSKICSSAKGFSSSTRIVKSGTASPGARSSKPAGVAIN
jgi:hypothetical protein